MDARVPERVAGDPVLDGVSDAAFRVWLNGLAWSVGQGTDGRIPQSALRFLHPDGPRHDAAAELVTAGVWKADGDGWRNVRHQDAQTTAQEADRLRANARERQRKSRANRANSSRSGHAANRDAERDASHPCHTEHGTQAPNMSRNGADSPPVGHAGDIGVTGPRDAARDAARQGKGNGEARKGELPPRETGPDGWPRELCDVCHEPMNTYQPGQSTHPGCERTACPG